MPVKSKTPRIAAKVHRPRIFRHCLGAGVLMLVAFAFHRVPAAIPPPPYGLDSRPASRPYLLMPELADGALPPLLSKTGAFKDARNLTPVETLIPYDLNVAFWSDGAAKIGRA